MWGQLRRGYYGVPVRRQHPIGPLIVDFAIPSRRLVIEVDGEGHDADRDAGRDRLLRSLGWRVHRVAVRDMDKDFGGVMEAIARVIDDPTLLDDP